jgi:hypothetical protein
MFRRCCRLVLIPRSVAVGLVLALAGCAPKTRDSLNSRYPPAVARAIVHVTETRDAESVSQLVNLLENDDRAIRLYAIMALERLTGETHGYRYHDPPSDRAAAVLRWREALQAGRVTLDPSRSTSMSEDRMAGARTHNP